MTHMQDHKLQTEVQVILFWFAGAWAPEKLLQQMWLSSHGTNSGMRLKVDGWGSIKIKDSVSLGISYMTYLCCCNAGWPPLKNKCMHNNCIQLSDRLICNPSPQDELRGIIFQIWDFCLITKSIQFLTKWCKKYCNVSSNSWDTIILVHQLLQIQSWENCDQCLRSYNCLYLS